jgi:hypothetical protein
MQIQGDLPLKEVDDLSNFDLFSHGSSNFLAHKIAGFELRIRFQLADLPYREHLAYAARMYPECVAEITRRSADFQEHDH